MYEIFYIWYVSSQLSLFSAQSVNNHHFGRKGVLVKYLQVQQVLWLQVQVQVQVHLFFKTQVQVQVQVHHILYLGTSTKYKYST